MLKPIRIALAVLAGLLTLPAPSDALEPLVFPDPVPAASATAPRPSSPGGIRQFSLRSGSEASAHFDLGLSQQSLGNHREAVLLFREALRFDPERREARERLADSHLALGEWEQARIVLEEILAVRPGHADALARLGIALSRLERHREAAIALGNALLFGPERPLERPGGSLNWQEIDDRRLAEVQVRLLLGQEYAALNDASGLESQITELGRLSHPAAANAADMLRRLATPSSRK